jgi:hypothetical protein
MFQDKSGDCALGFSNSSTEGIWTWRSPLKEREPSPALSWYIEELEGNDPSFFAE